MIPIACLHGLFGCPAEWTPLRMAYACAASDSDVEWQPQAIPAADSWNEGLDRLLAQLPPRSLLIGYSMGARLAIGCLLRAPHRFVAGVLISGNPGLEQPAERQARWQADQALAEQVLHESLPVFLDRWYRQPVFAGANAATRERWVAERVGLDRAYHAQLARSYSIAQQPDYWPEVKRIHLPCLLLAGSADPKYAQIMGRLGGQLPQAQYHLIPDVGHAVHREAPRQVAELLLSFTQRVHASTGAIDR